MNTLDSYILNKIQWVSDGIHRVLGPSCFTIIRSLLTLSFLICFAGVMFGNSTLPDSWMWLVIITAALCAFGSAFFLVTNHLHRETATG